MKTILVATDFSPVALNAAEYAVDMASVINADIVLLHTYLFPVSYSEAPLEMNLEEMQKIAEKNMSELKDQLAQKYKRINISTIINMGIFFDELQSVCETINPYVLVMGTQGTTAAERLLFGTHAIHAMKNLKWPLITVPPTTKFSAIKKIGLACDFNKVVDTIPIDEIKLLVNDFKSELHVLNTGKKKVFHPEIVFESGLLQEMLNDLKPKYHFISYENTDEGIMDFAEKNKIDLLIVLPKRHGLMEQLIHKSHTKEFVLHSHVPVMALHQ